MIYSEIMDAIENEKCPGLFLKTFNGRAILRTFGGDASFLTEEISLPEFIQNLYREQKGNEEADGISKNKLSI